MNAIATFRKCTLTDRELLEKVDSMTDKMYSNPPYEVPYRHIPARPNDDYDLLVGELILRFKERIESPSADQAGDKAEYAKQRAVEFEKWKRNNQWELSLVTLGEPMYGHRKTLETKTFSELYDLFTKENPE
jgi:hypothetical protein